MLSNVLLELLKWFVERQLKKWGRELDWGKVKADFVERVKLLVPGEEFDEIAAFAVGVMIDLVAAAFQSNPKLSVPQAFELAGYGLQRELAARGLANARAV